jgi:molybdate transport system regulatory protein
MKKKEIRLRCWIDIDGEKFFGPGPAQLLELIEEEGSIAKAAKRMDMSYKKAWDIIDDLNTRGQKPFVISRKGGDKGGGAEVTEFAKKFLLKYRALTNKLNATIEKDTEILKML